MRQSAFWPFRGPGNCSGTPTTHPRQAFLAAPPTPLLTLAAWLLAAGAATAQEWRGFPVLATPVADMPEGIAVADFNNDGIDDVACALRDNDTVAILLGKGTGGIGNGRFHEAVEYTAGEWPHDIAIADFNGDGEVDLVTCHYNSDDVSVLLGAGDGTFIPAGFFPVGVEPRYVTTADLDLDGVVDIVASNYGSESVSVLTGTGDGSFAPAIDWAVERSPLGVTVSDFNNDGYPDLAVGNWSSDTVSVLLNLGANNPGSFAQIAGYPTDLYPDVVLTGDLNGDSVMDIVTLHHVPYTISVLLGNVGDSGGGDGTFSEAGTFATGAVPSDGLIRDCNNDGIADLVVVCTSATGLLIYHGVGDGTFEAPVGYPTSVASWRLAVGDFNSDGCDDFVVTVRGSSSPISVLHCHAGAAPAESAFIAPIQSRAGGYVTDFTTGDFNSDGLIDVAAANDENIALLFGNGDSGAGDGTFLSSSVYRVSNVPSRNLATADFDGDGNVDFATITRRVSHFSETYLYVGMGLGDGSFEPPVGFGSFAPQYVETYGELQTGDFNGDGIVDLLVATSDSFFVRIGLGNGTFTDPVSYEDSGIAGTVFVVDLNDDSLDDVVVWGNSRADALIGLGDGTFLAPETTEFIGNFNSMADGDFDGDGFEDLAVGARNSARLGVLLGGGDGTFGAAAFFPLNEQPRRIATGDFNNDGVTDVVAFTSSQEQGISVVLGVGDGTFGSPVMSNVTGCEFDPVVSDLDGDGFEDLIAVCANGVSILLGNGDGTFSETMSYAAGENPRAISPADLNSDGNLDLVVMNGCDQYTALFVGSTTILMGTGNGEFLAPASIRTTDEPITITSADINNDGIEDLAVGYVDATYLEVLLGQGVAGTFSAPVQFELGDEPRDILVCNLNDDSIADLVTMNSQGTISVLIGSAEGLFSEPTAYSVGSAGGIALGDFNGDGIVDLAKTNRSLNTISILFGLGEGVFEAAQDFPVDLGPGGIVALNLNGDQFEDLAILHDNDSEYSLSLLLGTGSGEPAIAASYPVSDRPDGLLSTDLDGDGFADVVIVGSQLVTVLRGTGNGALALPLHFSHGISGPGVDAVDVNQDGLLDLVISSWYDTVTVMLNQGFRDSTAPTSSVTGPDGPINQEGSVIPIAFWADDTHEFSEGVAGVELFYQRNGGDFVQYPGGPFATSPILFDTSLTGGDGTYGFCTVAIDEAGNVEPAPASAQITVVFNDTTGVVDWRQIRD